MATVCIGAFMGQLDASIVTLAFPTLTRTFHATLGSVQWVGLSYLLVLVSLLTAIGRTADMLGRKLLYTYGFLLFILGSALCGLAPSLGALVAFRVVQGLGAAMLQANSVAIIVNAVPRERLGRAIGVQGAAQALGLALGPAIGGLLIALGGWRLIFFVNVPVGCVGAVLGWFLLPRSRHLAERTRFDWAGLGLFVPAASALLLAISYGDQLGWVSPSTLGLLAASLFLTVAFVRREGRTSAPMLDLALFKRTQFSAGIASGLLSYVVLFGVLLVVPFLLQDAQHHSPGTTGIELMLMPLGLGIVAAVSGRLAERVGARALTVSGMVLDALVLSVLALAKADPVVFLIGLGLVGIGLGAFTPPNNAAIMGSVPTHQTGMASGVLNMTRGLGTSLGLALTGLVFTLAAEPAATDPDAVDRGFVAAAIFLAAVALAAAGLSALRGRAALSVDPTLTAE